MKRIKDVANALARAKNILITGHVFPDGDAVGSVIALGRALSGDGRRVCMYFEDEVPAFLRFLPGSEDTAHTLSGNGFDVAAVLDCSDIKRVGSQAERIESIPTVVNIDHHRSNTGFGNVRFVDPDAPATSGIVYRILREMRLPLDAAVATNLYTGLLTDTGSFSYGNIDKNCFTMAANLVEAGADAGFIASSIYRSYPPGRLDLLRRALESVQFYMDGRVAVIAVTVNDLAETNSRGEDVRGFIDFPTCVPGVKVAVLLRETDDGVEVSLRAEGDVDVARVAETMGGGGHKNAAGYSYAGTLSESRLGILRQLEPFVEKSFRQ